jgi:altronate dehydratase
METETKKITEVTGTKRIMINNLDYVKVGMAELVEPFSKYGQIKEAFLSKPTAAGNKNAGWAILVVDDETADKILGATIVIANRVVRVRLAKPKEE